MRRPGEGVRSASVSRIPEERCAAGVQFGLEVDACGDRFELADAFLEVGHLDPSRCHQQVPVRGVVGQFEPLEFEPPVPGLEAGNTGCSEAAEDACRENANGHQVHHLSSCRSASISRASSSFWLLMWWSIAISRRSLTSSSVRIAWTLGLRLTTSSMRSNSLIRPWLSIDRFFWIAR